MNCVFYFGTLLLLSHVLSINRRLTPPELVAGRCDAAAGGLSPPSYDRSGTTSPTGPPED